LPRPVTGETPVLVSVPILLGVIRDGELKSGLSPPSLSPHRLQADLTVCAELGHVRELCGRILEELNMTVEEQYVPAARDMVEHLPYLGDSIPHDGDLAVGYNAHSVSSREDPLFSVRPLARVLNEFHMSVSVQNVTAARDVTELAAASPLQVTHHFIPHHGEFTLCYRTRCRVVYVRDEEPLDTFPEAVYSSGV